MTRTTEEFEQTLPTGVAVGLAVFTGVAVLFALTGRNVQVLMTALITALSEGGLAVIVFTAAAGYGGLLVRWLAPADTPKGLIVTTSFGAGLAILWTAVLAIGSTVAGGLSPWLWWPVVAGGLLLAAWQIRHFTGQLRWPSRVNGRQLIWMIIAAAGGIWLALATMPPGTVGVRNEGNAYDVLEYHLQVPREYHDAGAITALPHNVYSYYPSGVETVSLLTMTLRGGPHEGAQAAKFAHGLFGVLAVAAIMSTLRGPSPRGPFAGALLATTPFAIYLAGMAMVEMASVCYLVLACLWLRQWVTRPSIRTAGFVGAMIGAACATKYLAVLFVAAPVLAGMLLVTLLTSGRLRTIGHIIPTILLAGLVMSPWLIRNERLTGNPVFPLATSVFGRGHWSPESEARWVDGHAPDKRPPVPTPAGWQMPEQTPRLRLVLDHFLSNERFGPMVVLLTALGLCVLVAVRGKTDPWDWALFAIIATQLALWILLTQDMPGRFLVPIAAPMALAVGGLLDRISKMRGNPFRMENLEKRNWGPMGAGVTFSITAILNLLISYHLAGAVTPSLAGVRVPYSGVPASLLRDDWQAMRGVSATSRPMLVGEVPAFYMPAGTVYATAFDSHPLDEMITEGLSPADALARLETMGVTHVFIDWFEVLRLTDTYGYPASLSADALACREGETAAWRFTRQPALGLLEEMIPLGVTKTAPPDVPPVPGPETPVGHPTIYVMPWARAPEALVDPDARQ